MSHQTYWFGPGPRPRWGGGLLTQIDSTHTYPLFKGASMGDTKNYTHAEAFMLMQYESADGREGMLIWNSRDGVTPFGLSHPETGTELRHVRWGDDVRAPDHTPAVGDYIWVDLDPEKALQTITQRVERWWDGGPYPMREHFESKEAAVRVLFQETFESTHPNTGETVKLRPPDLMLVDEHLRELRGWA